MVKRDLVLKDLDEIDRILLKDALKDAIRNSENVLKSPLNKKRVVLLDKIF